MATFSTWAEVVTPDHPLARAKAEHGLTGTAKHGHLLADLLAESGGRYEAVLELPSKAREHISRAAEVTSDAELAAVARQERVLVSLEHLRQYDAATTRIYYGTQLMREESDDVWWDPAPGPTA
jgi:hypothetical protein